jgi:hypothetical protein
MHRRTVRTLDTRWVRDGLQAIAAIGLAGVMVGCSSLQTNYDFDPTANFAGYKTYMWKDVAPIKDAMVDQSIVRAVDQQLASKGLSKVETGGDLTITYHHASEKSLDTQSFGYTAGPAYGWGGWYGGGYGYYGGGASTSSSTTRVVTTGTLAIDLIQTSSNTLVYRTVASTEVGPPGTNTGINIGNIVAEMFKSYPPKK